MNPSGLHVVFGAGQVGLPLARLLASRGRQVRLVSRAGKPLPGGTGVDGAIQVAAAAGIPAAVKRMPRLMVKVLGLFMPPLREVDGMLYQWDEPFVADDQAFRARFGVLPTPPAEAARQTVAWARSAYARQA